MRKFKFKATLSGEIIIQDNDRTLESIESEIKNVIFCTLEDGNKCGYVSIGYNNKVNFYEVFDD